MISKAAISERKLHQLLYFAQRESLAITGQPMFPEQLYGWQYGAFSPDVSQYLQISEIETDTNDMDLDVTYIIDNVVLEYGSIASWKLSEISHNQLSWKNARIGVESDEKNNRLLQIEDIQKDAERIRPYDHVWDMYYDELEDLTEAELQE